MNIEAKIDHYQEGSLQNTIGPFTNGVEDKKALMSFGSRSMASESENTRERFITIDDATFTTLEGERFDDDRLSSFLAIEGEEEVLLHDEYRVVGAFVQNPKALEMLSLTRFDFDQADGFPGMEMVVSIGNHRPNDYTRASIRSKATRACAAVSWGTLI